MGMVSDIIATFSRKPLFGYKPMVFSIAGIAGLGFIVWGHHMFQSGMNPALGATFMLSTMMIALPSAIKVFNWLGTLWGARIQYTAAMLNAMAFVAMFIIGGLGGLWTFILVMEKILLGYELGRRPALLLAVLLVVVGVQFVSIGLLGEMLARTYHESQGKPIYVIREEF